MESEPDEVKNEFSEASEKPRNSFIHEILTFLSQNKKWWLLPIIIVFVLFGLLVVFSSSAAPFIYSLF